MAKRNFIPLVPSGTINADASVAQLEQDVLAMDAKVGELAEDIGDTEQEINQLKSQINEVESGFPQKSASGSIVTIEDGADNVPVVSLTAQIVPVQDLHGYENPWPAGGNSNLAGDVSFYTENVGVTVKVSDDGTITLNGTVEGNTFFVRGPFVAPDLTANYTWALFNNAAVGEFSTRAADVTSSGGWGRVSATNATKTFTIDEGKTPALWQLQVNQGTALSNFVFKPMIVQGSTAPTTYLPYSNICPISGWTGANVFDTGVNVWDEEWEQGDFNNNTGANYPSTTRCRSTNYIPISPSASYYFNSPEGVAAYLFFYDKDKTYIGFYGTNIASFRTFVPANLSNSLSGGASFSNAAYMRFCYDAASVPSESLSINYPSTDHSYHAYTGRTVNISWETEAGTVYGGSLKVENGAASVPINKKSLTFVGASGESWSYTPNYSALVDRASISISDALTGKGNQEIISNLLTFTTGDSLPWAGKTNNNGVLLVYLPVGSFADATEWKTWLASNNLQIVYNITPVVYEVDPAVIKTLYGLNNIWADTGDIDLVYRADPATYTAEQIRIMLNAMVANVEPTATASKAYSVNDFLILDNVLYKVIANIASGGTITINTNVSATTIGAEITNILNN